MSAASFKSSLFARSAQLIGMATKIAQHELSQQIRSQVFTAADQYAPELLKTRLAQARILTENLGQLKGAAMKAGQLISLDASDFLPEEVRGILTELQNKATSIDSQEILEILRHELGNKVDDFKGLDQPAIQAASIGQVHKAMLNGQAVAVKVQYPGVAESIDSDLKLLKKIIGGFLVVAGKRVELDEIFEELGAVLKQETQYSLELEFAQKFEQLLKSHPSYQVPRVYPDYSTERVLVMDWIEGQTLEDWMRGNPSQTQREHVAQLLLDLYCLEFFEWGLVQTDPNFANFLILEAQGQQGSEIRLGILDFGATLSYDEKFRNEYHELLLVLATIDRDRIIAKAIETGLLDQRESQEAKNLFAELMMSSIEPFQPQLQPFYFKDESYAKKARDIGFALSKELKFSPPPKKLIFLHRKLGGILQMLRRLDVSLNLTPYWLKMVGTELKTP